MGQPVDAAVNEELGRQRFEPPNRKRLSGPGLRTFLRIADLWRLSEQQRRLVLGYPSRSTYYGWTKAAGEHRNLTLGVDVLMRISAALGIHEALTVLFITEQEAVAWLHQPHLATVFGGKPPLDLMTCGTQDGLLTVRRFLDGARGGLYMKPNGADDLMSEESDISFV